MPLYDFLCKHCGTVKERLFTSLDAAMRDPVRCETCHRPTLRQQSSPGSIRVLGFSSMNGYASPRTITQKRGSVTTTVSGNFEAFSDGLV